MNGNALQRYGDVLSEKRAIPAEPLNLPIDIHVPIRHFATALGGDNEHGSDAAVDIDGPIPARRPGQWVDRVQFFLAVIQVGRDILDHPRPIMEGHLPECRTTHVTRPVEHTLNIQWRTARHGDLFPRNRADHRLRRRSRFDPMRHGIAGRSEHDGPPHRLGATWTAAPTKSTLLTDWSVLCRFAAVRGRNPK